MGDSVADLCWRGPPVLAHLLLLLLLLLLLVLAQQGHLGPSFFAWLRSLPVLEGPLQGNAEDQFVLVLLLSLCPWSGWLKLPQTKMELHMQGTADHPRILMMIVTRLSV